MAKRGRPKKKPEGVTPFEEVPMPKPTAGLTTETIRAKPPPAPPAPNVGRYCGNCVSYVGHEARGYMYCRKRGGRRQPMDGNTCDQFQVKG